MSIFEVVVDVFQQALQFQNRLARDDHFLAAEGTLDLHRRERQTVAVGGNRHQLLAVDDEQHAVQVITDVLLRHREMDHAEQLPEGLLRNRQARAEVSRLVDGRELVGGERLERETAFAGAHGEALVGEVERDFARRHRAQDVEQLARGNGGGDLIAAHAEVGMRGDLEFEVGREERHVRAILGDQQIGEDRQRMTAFYDTAHGLQRP